MKEELIEKLKFGDLNDIREVYFKHFHQIKHTISFGILIDRYEQVLKYNEDLRKYLEGQRIAMERMRNKLEALNDSLMEQVININLHKPVQIIVSKENIVNFIEKEADK
jgi:hypothetical protein